MRARLDRHEAMGRRSLRVPRLTHLIAFDTEKMMKAKDIVIGKSYRHKDHPRYGWAKAIKVLRPKEGENTTTRIIMKCAWSQDKDAMFSLIKYFSPSNLIEHSYADLP
jgi:hypothetical protein